jgi:alkanesulfonate monooxygenase SsuD/methylene tetrahydromethanopterin reductase-like flavin-dependent oxidoreductase (luciferase family)
MRFVFHTSASCADGTPQAQRYLEVADEAVLAEQVGFDVFSFGEQHFNTDGVTQVSCPEVMSAWVAGRTSVIKLRWSSVILLGFNHPLRTAERIATLDVISEGRLEVATARSNHRPTLAAFEIPPSETRAQWAEALDVVIAALRDSTFEHCGRFWNIPPTAMVPSAIQRPHPPLYYASTSLDGLQLAGKMGLGVMSGNSLPGGWEYVAECAETYHRAIDAAEPVTVVNRALCESVMTAHCAPTMEQALAEASPPATGFVKLVIDMFAGMADQGSDYAYMSNVEQLTDRADDMAWMNDRAPYISAGTPDFHIERLKRLESLGYDEVIYRIDGMGHTTNMASIELFGEEVIPAFR